jgi:hypothetical protein
VAAQGTDLASPVNSFILHASDGAELVLQAWLPQGPIRQVLMTTVGPVASEAKAQVAAASCAELGVATFALHPGAGRPAPVGRFAAFLGRRARDGAPDRQSAVLGWLRMLYPGVPIWVIGDDGRASLVAASPAEARRIVRQAAALT